MRLTKTHHEEVTAIDKRKRRIRLPSVNEFQMRGVDIPSFIWQQAPFVFDPQSFVPSSERLDQRPYDEELQLRSLLRFENEPMRPAVYAVCSEPNDSVALYFAAYLVNLYMKKSPSLSPNVRWERIYGGFQKRNYEAESTDLLVLSNLSPSATAPKLEYARDLLDIHARIPRIVVVAGEDPISFFATRLYFKVNYVFFHSSKLVKRRVEVV